MGRRSHAALGLRSGRWPNNRADAENQLRRIPLPARDHSPSDIVLPPVHPQLAQRRGFVGGTWSGGVLRDGSALGEPFRTDDRGRLAKASPEAYTTWHLDEVYLKIDGQMVYVWWAVDAQGEILDVLVQSKRNKHAALKLTSKLLKKYAFVPERWVTDDVRSYSAAVQDLGIERRHERERWKNNRAENSHQPTRRRERKMQRFKVRVRRRNFCPRTPLSTTPLTSNVISPRPKRRVRLFTARRATTCSK